jgi:mono/diheme cytochrome c family protein
MFSVRPRRFAAVSALLSALCIGASAYVAAQAPSRTVAAGVFTDAQAARGATEYEAQCSGCHNPDLAGGSGPSLKEQRFARDYAGKDLTVLFTKISKTMPRDSPGTLEDQTALDIVAHILKQNGFRAGTAELTGEGLEGVQLVAGRPKPPPPPGDFSYVEVVGCLTTTSQGAWLLTKASDPITVIPVAAAPGDAPSPQAEVRKPLGTRTVHLLDAMAYTPDAHKGHKMLVRGILVKLPDEQRMTISSFSMVAPSCTE